MSARDGMEERPKDDALARRIRDHIERWSVREDADEEDLAAALVALVRAERAAQAATITHLRELLAGARVHMGTEYERYWPDDPDFDALCARIDALLGAS